jgi:hypothetical protein
MKYGLDLSIDPADLIVFKGSGMNIQVAKLVGNASKPNVVWLSIDPWAEVKIDWEEAYGIYASNTQLQAGAVIQQISGIPSNKTEDQISYALGLDTLWTKDPSAPLAPPGTYSIENQMVGNPLYPSLVFGLTQPASVNGNGTGDQVLNATSVLPNNGATFTPLTTVYIWMQGQQQCGSVIVGITSKTAVVTMQGGDTLKLHYDHNLGRFEIVNGPAAQVLLPKGIIYSAKK